MLATLLRTNPNWVLTVLRVVLGLVMFAITIIARGGGAFSLDRVIYRLLS